MIRPWSTRNVDDYAIETDDIDPVRRKLGNDGLRSCLFAVWLVLLVFSIHITSFAIYYASREQYGQMNKVALFWSFRRERQKISSEMVRLI